MLLHELPVRQVVCQVLQDFLGTHDRGFADNVTQHHSDIRHIYIRLYGRIYVDEANVKASPLDVLIVLVKMCSKIPTHCLHPLKIDENALRRICAEPLHRGVHEFFNVVFLYFRGLNLEPKIT